MFFIFLAADATEDTAENSALSLQPPRSCGNEDEAPDNASYFDEEEYADIDDDDDDYNDADEDIEENTYDSFDSGK